LDEIANLGHLIGGRTILVMRGVPQSKKSVSALSSSPTGATGHLPPSSGTITFEGRDITGLPSRRIMGLGISRSFQVAQVFPTYTVFENLCAAIAIAHSGQSVIGAALTRFISPRTASEAEAALARF
jgi:ABC-type branched-subunit amino acid transport system ATPase component